MDDGPVTLDVTTTEAETLAAIQAKKHHFNQIAYFIVMMLGAGLLLPWNAVVAAVDYFNLLYPGRQIEFVVGIAYIVPQLWIVAAMVKWGERISFTLRIVSMFIIQGVLLVMVPITAEVTSHAFSYWATLMYTFLIGVTTSILQPSVFGFSSQLPPMFNQAIMAGQGVAGVGVCVVRLLLKAAIPSPRINALLFFCFSCLVMFACVVGYYGLLRMEFTQYHLEKSRRRAAMQGEVGSPAPLERAETDASYLETPTKNGLSRGFTLRVLLSNTLGLKKKDNNTPLLQNEQAEDGGFVHMMKSMWVYAIGVMLIFVMTFAVFPGEITSIKYLGTFHALNFVHGSYWAVVLVTVFNIFDLTGRSAASKIAKYLNHKFVMFMGIARFIFVPLFILNVHNPDPHVFSDLFALIMVACYALSNGLTSTVAMMQAPSTVAPHLREKAGFFMTLFLQAGIFLGAISALGVKALNKDVG